MSEQASISGWDISVACSLSLNDSFGKQGIFRGFEVTVDPEAIDATIASMDPPTDARLLFEITTSEDNIDTLDVRHTVKQLGGVPVGIAYVAEQAKHRVVVEPEEGKSDCYAAATDPLLVTAVCVDINDDINATAVHELRHAVDYLNPEIQKAELQYAARNERHQLASTIAAFGSLAMLGGILAHKAVSKASKSLETRIPQPVSIGIGILGGIGLAATKPAQAINRHYGRKALLRSPLERRAYSAEANPPHHAPLVSISRKEKRTFYEQYTYFNGW